MKVLPIHPIYIFDLKAIMPEPSAERPLSERWVNQDIVKRIENREDFMDALDSWILIADEKLLPKLKELSAYLKPFYVKQKTLMFRGFGNAWDFQDTMGLPLNKKFFSTSLAVEEGEKFTYKNKLPISTSTDLDIALAFGGNVAVTREEIEMFDNNLPITNELAYVINKRRNLTDKVTQNEVILFPGKYDFELLLKD